MFVYYIFLFGLFYHHVMSTQEVVLCIYFCLLPKFSIVIIFSILDILKKSYLLWDELNFKYEKFFKMEFYFFVCELFIDVLLFVIGENKQIF